MRREGEEGDDAYAAMGWLGGRGDDFALFAGAISVSGTLCHPVTSGIGPSSGRRCISAGAGNDPRRAK